jgi:two-component system C4-dicarboxylate transport sensor histidine kinase DctB
MSSGGLNPRLEVGDRPAHSWLRQHVHAQQWLKRYAGVLLLIAAGIYWSYQYTEQLGIETIRRAAVHRIDIYDTALKSE